MKMSFHGFKLFILSFAILPGVMLTFQNCSKTKFSDGGVYSQSSLSFDEYCKQNAKDPVCEQPLPVVRCNFNGETLFIGQTITAYQNSKVNYGEKCSSQMRECFKDGSLSGSYNYAKCEVGLPAACLFNGVTVAHGAMVPAYQNSTVPYGSTCMSEQRKCDNGMLSGSFSYGKCDVDKPAACLFNGKTIPHGESVASYLKSSVPYGESCKKEDRLCLNGTLSGNYAYGSCEVDKPAACMFNGKTIAHGETTPAYQNSTVPYGNMCVKQDRKCENGTLSGNYNYANCEVGKPASCMFNNQTYAHGEMVKAYKTPNAPFGANCDFEERKCDNGALSGTYAYGTCVVDMPKSCMFNGATLAHLQTVDAFQNSSVAYDKTCVKETRTCTNGSLSGSYNYASCMPATPKSCMFNGQTIAHGQTAVGYQNSTVPYGEDCVKQTRTCTDGTLSGSYNYGSCEADKPKSCLFNGVTVTHDATVKAYQTSVVDYGGTCTEEVRKCNNGTLSGSYAYGSCAPGAPKSCLFNGMTIPHDGTTQAWQNSTVAYNGTCVQETRKCANGALSGSYNYATCSPAAPAACSFNGSNVAHGETVSAFQNSSVPFGGTCVKESRTCSNGSLSGSYAFGSCAPANASSCLFNGMTVPHNSSTQAFLSSSVAYGATCSQETRTCNNGSLSGSYTFGSCAPAAAKSCTFNGVTVAHGENVNAYQNSSVAYGGACVKEVRSCNNGSLSGSYTYASCAPAAAASCLFNGNTVAHGQSVSAYQNSSVAYGGACVKENRVCDNGSLSGTYAYGSCTPAAAASCLFNGQSIAHGGSTTAYMNSNVNYGSTCSSQERSCDNGTLSGSYSFGSCTVGQPASCLFDGKTVAHGESVSAYASSTVSYGGTCTGETRTCDNAVLSGSYIYPSCSPQAAASCLFNGATVAHGQSVVAYLTTTVASGSTCSSQNRTCDNGSLSGSYSNSNCEVLPPDITPVTCTNLSNIQGDMAVSFTSAGGGYYNLSFGTWADNYWGNGQYDRQMNFYIDNLSQIESMVLNQAAFDDWVWVQINGVSVYFGPYPNYGITSMYLSGSTTVTNVGNFKGELSTSWNQSPSVDLKPYLRQGSNTIWTRTIVQGGGESYIKMQMKRTCTGVNDPGPGDTGGGSGGGSGCFSAQSMLYDQCANPY